MRLTKANAILISLLVGIHILTAELPISLTSHAQIQDPELSCLKFGECELITCNPDGSYTYTFEVTNTGAFAATVLEFRNITPSGANISINPYPLTPPLLPNWTRQVTVTIGPGVPAGSTLCFTLSIHDREDLNCCSSTRKCIKLPDCGRPVATCASGGCCGGVPRFHDNKFTSFIGKRLAVTTSRATMPTNTGYPAIQSEAVLRVIDLSESGFVLNTNIAAPMYYGPGNQWTRANLGTIFGVTLDQNGNIFAAASSAYNRDFYPATGTWPSGTIWRIDGITGARTIFAQLENFKDPTLATQGYTGEEYPALGDVTYDCRNQQFFATNLEDGKIYRLKSATTNNLSASSVNTTTFDPFTPDPGLSGGVPVSPGFAPLGERLVAVEVHNNRVYYSVWREDCGNPNPNVANEIWSVGLNPTTGDFVPSDNRKELELPQLLNEIFSPPVFDISFSREGNMLVAERTMRCNPGGPLSPANETCGSSTLTSYAAATLSAAHASRVLEYSCTGGTEWTLTSPYTTTSGTALPYRFNVGNHVNSAAQCSLGVNGRPANAAGGIDYDYSPLKYIVWATGDSLLPGQVPVPYGLQGFEPGGGGMASLNGLTTAVAIDVNGILAPGTYTDKAQVGDVEIVCPLPGMERPR